MTTFRRICICLLLLKCSFGCWHSTIAAISFTGHLIGEYELIGGKLSSNIIDRVYSFQAIRDGALWNLKIADLDDPRIYEPIRRNKPHGASIVAGFDGDNTYVYRYSPDSESQRGGFIFSGALPTFQNTAATLVWLALCSDPSFNESSLPTYWAPPLPGLMPIAEQKEGTLEYSESGFISKASYPSFVDEHTPTPKTTYSVTEVAFIGDKSYPKTGSFLAWPVGSGKSPGIWRLIIDDIKQIGQTNLIPAFEGTLYITDVRKSAFYKAAVPVCYYATNKWPGEKTEFVRNQAELWKAAGNPLKAPNSAPTVSPFISFLLILTSIVVFAWILYRTQQNKTTK